MLHDGSVEPWHSCEADGVVADDGSDEAVAKTEDAKASGKKAPLSIVEKMGYTSPTRSDLVIYHAQRTFAPSRCGERGSETAKMPRSTFASC